MRFSEATLSGVIIVEPDVFGDARGFFMETYHAKKYAEGGIREAFVQDNFSRSVRNTLRGLHYQYPNAQGKLVSVVSGEVFDVAVDIRKGSPHFGKWFGVRLSEENKKQVYVPSGFAHGFCVLSETAEFVYKCTTFYSPKDERGILWNDPAIGIRWPVSEPILSEKDQVYKTLKESEKNLPVFSQR